MRAVSHLSTSVSHLGPSRLLCLVARNCDGALSEMRQPHPVGEVGGGLWKFVRMLPELK